MTFSHVIQLLILNLIYALVSVCTRWASGGAFLSGQYLLGLAGAVAMLGVYALWWQQILKQIPLAKAYMFKGTSVVFVLLFSVGLFGEHITMGNVLGTCLIIAGIMLYARSDT